jgi:hypothetical protein
MTIYTAADLDNDLVVLLQAGLLVALLDEAGDVRFATPADAAQYPHLRRLTLDELRQVTQARANVTKWN